MKKLKFCFIFINLISLCIFQKQSFGQAKTAISGTIENAANDSVQLVIDKTYLSQKQISYLVPVKQNKFVFEFQLDRNCLVEISYKEQRIQLYLEPNDSLDVKFKADNLPESIAFSGKDYINNQFYNIFNTTFKNDFTASIIDERMKVLHPDEFEMLIYDNRKKHKNFYTNYPDKNLFSAHFKKFIENHIKYNYLNFLLSYPVVNANKSTAILTVSPLPPLMLEMVDKKTVSDEEAMISDSYRNFLTSFVTYYASELNGFNKFKDYTISTEKKYVIASDYLDNEPFLFYLTNFLLEMGEKTNPETVKRIFSEMEKKENKTAAYTEILKEKLGKWMKTKAPKNVDAKLDVDLSGFKLLNLEGKEISLSKFNGNVIYVDFWASWCGPCKQQFPYSKLLYDQLSDKQKKQVVFLYISLDNTADIWKKALNNLQLEGEHALSPGGWNSEAAKYYKINSIPRYVLIDKKGNVINQNAKRPSDDGTLQDILNLLE